MRKELIPLSLELSESERERKDRRSEGRYSSRRRKRGEMERGRKGQRSINERGNRAKG